MRDSKQKEQWARFLAHDSGEKDLRREIRTPFHKDFDRILFSAAFRRLQDKTQVYPLAQNDHVRRRLTHSLEVASVGRCLGRSLGHLLVDRGNLPSNYDVDCVGTIVSAACLAHDIGNPPFGHAGERAIAKWFETPTNERLVKDSDNDSLEISQEEFDDFRHFNGNAQGLRILLSLDENINYGGMRLNSSTVTAYTKYPHTSIQENLQSNKKVGIFQFEREKYAKHATLCDISPYNNKDSWRINPLNLLVEASDDICNYFSDFEDMYKLDLISFNEAEEILQSINNCDRQRYRDKKEDGKISYSIASSIGKARVEIEELVKERLDSFSTGEVDYPLIEEIPSWPKIRKLVEYREENVFKSQRMAKIESMGYEIITFLLDHFVEAAINQEQKKKDSFCQRYLRIVDDMSDDNVPRYQRLLRVTDFISSMTDSHALSLYQELRGIRLPVAFT